MMESRPLLLHITSERPPLPSSLWKRGGLTPSRMSLHACVHVAMCLCGCVHVCGLVCIYVALWVHLWALMWANLSQYMQWDMSVREAGSAPHPRECLCVAACMASSGGTECLWRAGQIVHSSPICRLTARHRLNFHLSSSMNDKELTDDPFGIQALLEGVTQGFSRSLWWGQLQRRDSNARRGQTLPISPPPPGLCCHHHQ